MFKNIGAKIKTATFVFCILGIIGCVVAGVISFFGSLIEDASLLFVSFFFMFVAPVIVWVSCFMAYGFGQLVENSDEIVDQLKKEKKEATKRQNNEVTGYDTAFFEVHCPYCNACLRGVKENIDSDSFVICSKCGGEFSIN